MRYVRQKAERLFNQNPEMQKRSTSSQHRTVPDGIAGFCQFRISSGSEDSSADAASGCQPIIGGIDNAVCIQIRNADFPDFNLAHFVCSPVNHSYRPNSPLHLQSRQNHRNDRRKNPLHHCSPRLRTHPRRRCDGCGTNIRQ